MSYSVRSILSPILLPLFRIERWDRQAALGREVVPDVNWMLMMSWGCSELDGKGSRPLPSNKT